MASISYQPTAAFELSHELRIPLTGIMGMTHLLDETPLDAQQKQYLELIKISAQRLLSLETKLHALLQRT